MSGPCVGRWKFIERSERRCVESSWTSIDFQVQGAQRLRNTRHPFARDVCECFDFRAGLSFVLREKTLFPVSSCVNHRRFVRSFVRLLVCFLVCCARLPSRRLLRYVSKIELERKRLDGRSFATIEAASRRATDQRNLSIIRGSFDDSARSARDFHSFRFTCISATASTRRQRWPLEDCVSQSLSSIDPRVS